LKTTTLIFDTVIDLVNIKREGNILQDAMLPSSGEHSQSFWQWRVVELSPDDIFYVFHVFLVKEYNV